MTAIRAIDLWSILVHPPRRSCKITLWEKDLPSTGAGKINFTGIWDCYNFKTLKNGYERS